MLTQERANELSEIINSNKERAKELLENEPEVALAYINALGNDFTLSEIKEYGKAVKALVAQQGDLDADALESVSGGFISPALTVFAIGVILGGAEKAKITW